MKSSAGEVKLFIGILIAALLLVGVAVYPSLRQPPTRHPTPPKEVKASDLLPEWSRAKGDPKAPITIVEFGDYMCPSCASAKGEVKAIESRHPGKIRHIFHHYQIRPDHVHANFLARVAEAAGAQGKFWEMHEALFKAQDGFKDIDEKTAMERALKVASGLRLDVLKLRSDVSRKEYRDAVDRMNALAEKVQVMHTPTFFVIPPGGKVARLEGIEPLNEWFSNPDNLK